MPSDRLARPPAQKKQNANTNHNKRNRDKRKATPSTAPKKSIRKHIVTRPRKVSQSPKPRERQEPEGTRKDGNKGTPKQDTKKTLNPKGGDLEKATRTCGIECCGLCEGFIFGQLWVLLVQACAV
eukprot:5421882-Amphidinium_carterae.4